MSSLRQPGLAEWGRGLAALLVGLGIAGGPVSAQEAPAPAKPSAAERAETVLVSLAKKANGGDEAAARDLVKRLLALGPVSMDESFENEVAAASPTEAARIFGLTLLRTGQAQFEEQGMSSLEQAVAGGSVLAMEAMAQILLEGRFGRERSVTKAVELLKDARQLPGATEAHRLLGDLALAGTGMPQDPAIALEYYRRGAEAGAVSCLLALHRLFREEGQFPKDLVEAERYGKAAAEAGGAAAIGAAAAWEMGRFYELYASEEPQWLRAAEWLRQAVERGHVEAALRLSDYHLEGRIGAVDSAEGIRLLRAVAALGNAEACYRIGDAYRQGVHLPQDPVAATAWFRIAADFGHPGAENAYGLALATGQGVSSDPAAARTWFERAAKQGSVDAKTNLGELHQFGLGGARDAREAARHFEEAARAGSLLAAEKLARLLSEEAALRDLPRAAYWAARAAAGDRTEAVALARDLRGQLSSEQREELDRALADPGPGKGDE